MVITLITPEVLDRVRFNAGESFNAPDAVAEMLIAQGRAVRKVVDGPPVDKLAKPVWKKQARADAGATLEDR